ncbi:MAG: sodium-dependent transporter [Gammaproteobacteria bacterium]|nr:sodium-dependent transporter [Gammaproteobacteria bacterium]MDD9896672.1 sodium-dependent transporter [Gammaproteobacteria bacterium]MDD9957408.1 sodium-dependent transporter [Gammaproteobacteria bacterium]
MATPTTERWTSRFSFLMIGIGAAVGLGNLWRFPFQAGENGGSAFVLVYLLCIIVIVYPVLIGELAVGRHMGLSAVGSTKEMAVAAGRSPWWGLVGGIGAFATYMVLCIYGVISGRVLAFAFAGFTGGYVEGAMPEIYATPLRAFFWQTLFMIITVSIVWRGLNKGIESFTRIAMPAFFVMLVLLSIYSLLNGRAGDAFDYLLSPRFDELTPAIMLAAFGQAFFSVVVGGAAMLTIGAYMDKQANIANDGVFIATSDTIVALVAGLMIFPIVFQFGLDPAMGMGLIFSTMPLSFLQMPAGSFVGGLFFTLAALGALTSSITMLLLSAVAVEEQLELQRKTAVIALGTIAWVVGAFCVFYPNLNEELDFLSGQVILPIGGILIAVFAGWIAPREVMRKELSGLSETLFSVWRYIVRYIAPLLVGGVLILGVSARF